MGFRVKAKEWKSTNSGPWPIGWCICGRFTIWTKEKKQTAAVRVWNRLRDADVYIYMLVWLHFSAVMNDTVGALKYWTTVTLLKCRKERRLQVWSGIYRTYDYQGDQSDLVLLHFTLICTDYGLTIVWVGWRVTILLTQGYNVHKSILMKHGGGTIRLWKRFSCSRKSAHRFGNFRNFLNNMFLILM